MLLLRGDDDGALDGPRETSLCDGGVNGRNPPPLFAGDWLVPRGPSIVREFMPELAPSELDKPDERPLPLGGVKGRKLPLLPAGDWLVPRADGTFDEPVLLEFGFAVPIRSEPPRFDARLVPAGGLNERYPPLF